MAPPRMWWFKVECGITRSPKIRRLPREHRWLFIALLAVAMKGEEDGAIVIKGLGPATLEDLADEAGPGYSVEDIDAGLKAMEHVGLIELTDETWVVADWKNHQVQTSTARVKKHRAAKAQDPLPTPPDDGGTPADDDTATKVTTAAAAQILGNRAAERHGADNPKGYAAKVRNEKIADQDLAGIVLDNPTLDPDAIADIYEARYLNPGRPNLTVVPPATHVPPEYEPEGPVDPDQMRANAERIRELKGAR